MSKRRLQMLDLLGLDRIEPLVAEQRDQVNVKNRFLGGDPARLQTIRLRVPIDETRREFSDRGFLLHLLYLDRLWFAVYQQHSLACFCRTLRCGLARRWGFLALANDCAVREFDADVDLPAAVYIRSYCDAHRC
jgi:hypothetical protein